MKRGVCVVVVCLLLSFRIFAVDVETAQADMFAADQLWDGLDDRSSALMEDYDPIVQADLMDGVGAILSDALDESSGFIRTTLGVMLRIAAVLIFCRMMGAVGGEKTKSASVMVGALAISAFCVSDVRSMVGLGQNTLDHIGSFTTLLLPVLAAAATASGGVSSGAALYAVSSLFCDLLVRICRYLLIPMVYAYLALGLADCALSEDRLKKFRELIGWCIKTLLKGVLYLFTGFLAATGVISGTADASVLKAAKLTISGMVPVVGSIVSDATESILAGAGVLKSAIGTFGMLAVVSIFALPFLQLGISYLGFRLTAAIGGLLESGQGRLLDTLTSAMGYVLAMVGSCTIMALISCCCFIQVASG